jgi:outer membrane protein assembly factor BamB
MSVIELGLVRPDGDEPVADPGRSPMRLRDRRRLLAALLVACCLLTTAGSARPGPGGLPTLWSAPFGQDVDSFRLVDGTLYVLTQRGGRRLTAHDARSGTVRWSTTDIGDTTWMTTVTAGVLLMPAGFTTITHEEADGSSYSREYSRDTIAVDAATGRRKWRQPGEFMALVGDRVLLSEWNETGEQARRVRVVRLSDGGTVWARESGDLAFWTTDTTPGAVVDRLVTVTPKGRVEVIAPADGTVVTTGRLPWTGPAPSNDSSAITVQGRRIYLDQNVRNEASVSSYDIDTLRRLWRVEQSSPGGSYGCGPVVCVSDGVSMAGHDRETGVLRWQLTGASGGYPLVGDRLMVDEDGGSRRALVDATTGRRLADLGAAMPVWDSLARGTPYLLTRTREPAGRTAVSSFDPGYARVTLRGAIVPVLDYSCQNEGVLLACVTEDNQLIVTDVG